MIHLNENQKRAVETAGKNILVSAGAGSGKTRVLVERFLHLVSQRKISPAAILAITFTERAANEMKRRIVQRLREEELEEARREVEGAAIGTIHSFAARLLREHPIEAGIDPHFVIYEEEQASLLKDRVLEEVLEKGAADPEVFNFLKVYGEKAVREGILGAFARSRNGETPFEEILRRCSPAERESFELELDRQLEKIPEVKGAAEARPALGRLFREKDWGPETLTELLEIRSTLRASGPKKAVISSVKETLLDLVAFLREEASPATREVFIQLALQFEKAYEEAKRSERALDFDDLQLGAVRLLGAGTPASETLRKIYREKFAEILVDEYQDTNRLQDRLFELVRRKNNLFVVGDFKQSIYAFRGTEVRLFLEREKAQAQSSHGVRISLAENYRSRPSVIRFVNSFFETLWREDGIPFEPLEATRPEEGEGPRVEWLALAVEKEEPLEAVRIREARTLAHHIQTLVIKEGFRYRDIACLFEAMTPVHFYEQELRRLEIPYFVVSNRGFYAQPEVRDVVNFLSALENPKRDIPLASSLRSPLFQISDDTLFWLARGVKEKNKKAPLAEGVAAFESSTEISGSEKEKLRFFSRTFSQFLEEKEKIRISEMIEKLLHRTGYDRYVLKLRQGERRYVNLRKLVEIAREMEAKGTLHLGDFVRAVIGFETREVRESQAQAEAEEGDVVRLLSIHTAKGLEFPVVILPDLGRGGRPEGNPFLVSEEEGFGIKVRNEKTWKFEETLTFRRTKARLERIRSEESKRLLYVAMTRAKERLILSGPAESEEKEGRSFHEMSSWAKWVDRILSEKGLEVSRLCEVPAEPFPYERRRSLAERRAVRSRLENLKPLPLRREAEETSGILEQITLPERAYFERIDLPVSAFLLFEKDPEEYFRVYEIGAAPDPAFGKPAEIPQEAPSEEEALTPAEFGTRVHQILEKVTLRRSSLRGAESLVRTMTQELTAPEREEILEMTLRFLKSETGKEILKSKVIRPELPFVLRLPHGVIHGTLDLLTQDSKGEWRILDYKTSRADESNLTELGEAYRVQMELYALGFCLITGEPPREGRIHFLRPGLTHSISFQDLDFEKLFVKFTELQKEILRFRKERMAQAAAEVTGIFPGRS